MTHSEANGLLSGGHQEMAGILVDSVLFYAQFSVVSDLGWMANV